VVVWVRVVIDGLGWIEWRERVTMAMMDVDMVVVVVVMLLLLDDVQGKPRRRRRHRWR